jgi:hypothetical protein
MYAETERAGNGFRIHLAIEFPRHLEPPIFRDLIQKCWSKTLWAADSPVEFAPVPDWLKETRASSVEDYM